MLEWLVLASLNAATAFELHVEHIRLYKQYVSFAIQMRNLREFSKPWEGS